jgi:threonine dehydrogenase-like Zn-dependent dehydrogenase
MRDRNRQDSQSLCRLTRTIGVSEHLHGGPAPVRRFLPELVDLIWNRQIDPGKVFDLSLPLEQAAEGYRAMDERRAIKTLLRPRSQLSPKVSSGDAK